jgi:hypothetical protein
MLDDFLNEQGKIQEFEAVAIKEALAVTPGPERSEGARGP